MGCVVSVPDNIDTEVDELKGADEFGIGFVGLAGAEGKSNETVGQHTVTLLEFHFSREIHTSIIASMIAIASLTARSV